MSRTPLSRRMVIARQHANLSRLELAQKVSKISSPSIDEAQIAALEDGSARYSKRLIDIAIACGVEIEWLGLNQGPMLKGSAESELAKYRDAPVTDKEMEILALWRQIPWDMRDPVEKILRRFAMIMDPNYQATETALRDAQHGR